VDQPIKVTYRQTDEGWEPLLSTGGRLAPESGLAAARAAVELRLGAVPAPGTETVQVPMEGHGVLWAGLRFELLPPLYGADAPTAAQNARLTSCFEYYQARVPAGMRVECAGNRVRVDPSPSGLAGDLFAALDGSEPPGPNGSGADHSVERAREQLSQATAIEVPPGFVRVVHEFVGLEEFGEVGHLHLVLSERWPADAPCL
jgi:hypothetical protein